MVGILEDVKAADLLACGARETGCGERRIIEARLFRQWSSRVRSSLALEAAPPCLQLPRGRICTTSTTVPARAATKLLSPGSDGGALAEGQLASKSRSRSRASWADEVFVTSL